MSRLLGWSLLVTACSSHTAAVVDADRDATPNVDPCAAPYPLTPVTVSGTSPRGSLDIYHYAAAWHLDCPDAGVVDAYLVGFVPSELGPSCASTALTLFVFPPYSTTGTHRAQATETVEPSAVTDATDNVTFEATQLDPPDAMPPHIRGRFVSHGDPAWSIDVAVDLISAAQASCL